MIRRIVTALILLPLAIVVISVAVANRQSVVVSFDPFDQAHPALTRALPPFSVQPAPRSAQKVSSRSGSWITPRSPPSASSSATLTHQAGKP